MAEKMPPPPKIDLNKLDPDPKDDLDKSKKRTDKKPIKTKKEELALDILQKGRTDLMSKKSQQQMRLEEQFGRKDKKGSEKKNNDESDDYFKNSALKEWQDEVVDDDKIQGDAMEYMIDKDLDGDRDGVVERSNKPKGRTEFFDREDSKKEKKHSGSEAEQFSEIEAFRFEADKFQEDLIKAIKRRKEYKEKDLKSSKDDLKKFNKVLGFFNRKAKGEGKVESEYNDRKERYKEMSKSIKKLEEKTRKSYGKYLNKLYEEKGEFDVFDDVVDIKIIDKETGEKKDAKTNIVDFYNGKLSEVEKAKQESLREKDQKWYGKLWENYKKLPKSKRLAISVALAGTVGVGVGIGTGLGLGGALAYGSYRGAKSLGKLGVSSFATAGVDKVMKKINKGGNEKDKQKMEEGIKKGFSEKNEDILKNILDFNKKQKRRNIDRMVAIGLSGAGLSYAIMNFDSIDKALPGVSSRIDYNAMDDYPIPKDSKIDPNAIDDYPDEQTKIDPNAMDDYPISKDSRIDPNAMDNFSDNRLEKELDVQKDYSQSEKIKFVTEGDEELKEHLKELDKDKKSKVDLADTYPRDQKMTGDWQNYGKVPETENSQSHMDGETIKMDPELEGFKMVEKLGRGDTVWGKLAESGQFEGDKQIAGTLNKFRVGIKEDLMANQGLTSNQANEYIEWKFRHMKPGEELLIDKEGNFTIAGFDDEKNINRFKKELGVEPGEEESGPKIAEREEIITEDPLNEKAAESYSKNSLEEIRERETVKASGYNISDKELGRMINDVSDSDLRLMKNFELANNNITDKGVDDIIKIIRNPNSEVVSIDLSGNNISEKGAKKLIDALVDPDTKLTKLNLADNNISRDFKNKIFEDGKIKTSKEGELTLTSDE